VSGPTLLPLTPAHLAGLGALQLSVLLLLLPVPLWTAGLPLALLVALLLTAPFFPGWRLFGPYITRGDPAAGGVSLTFDDGPDAATTGPLLDLLARRGVKACFFQVGRKVQANPELSRRALREGHELANHSRSHDPLLMLRSAARLAREVAGGQEALAAVGAHTRCFRPPVGIVNPRLWPALLRQGLVAVGFSRRAMDWGNRRVQGTARRLLRGVAAGDILLLHDGHGGADFDAAAWLAEVEAVLDGLEQRGLPVLPLSRLLNQPVMEPHGSAAAGAAGAAAAFYDGLAPGYDAEQVKPAASPVREAEQQVVQARLAELVQQGDRVLEIGAGTGRFTVALARRAASVTAVDVSPGMLQRLEARAAREGLDNVTTLLGPAGTVELQGTYQLICSFSALEYMPDLRGVLTRLARHLEPGGHLLFTTAHRGPLRFIVQLGNAMRQGIWLYARSRAGVRRDLAAAGLSPVSIRTHGLRLPLLGGMLLEVVARSTPPSGAASGS